MKNKYNQHAPDLGTLTSNLQKEDRRNIRMTRNFQILMWIMAPLYLILFNFGMGDEITIYDRIEGACFALAFLSFAMIFRKYYKVYTSVDYGVPTTEMLQKAIERYRFQFKKIPFLLMPIVLIDLAVTIRSLTAEEGIFHGQTIKFQFIYWGMMSAAVFVGYMIWRRKQKPILDASKELLKEILGE